MRGRDGSFKKGSRFGAFFFFFCLIRSMVINNDERVRLEGCML